MTVTIPLPASIPQGFPEAAEAAGLVFWISPSGLNFPDAATETAAASLLAGYVGSAAQLTYWKTITQAALDDEFNSHFDLAAFIRAGTATSVTDTQVGTFLATITNNYRSKRASIATAGTVAAVQAINIAAGWPSNP